MELVTAGQWGLLQWYGPRGDTGLRPSGSFGAGAGARAGHEFGSEPVGGQALGQALSPLFALPPDAAPLLP